MSRIIIRAICRNSDEMERMEGLSRLSAYGPRAMPVSSMPTMRGNLSSWHRAAIASPARKIREREASMGKPSFKMQKS